MQNSRRRKENPTNIVEHEDEKHLALQDPEEFLDRNHPQNDAYMLAVEHTQRKIMFASKLLRTKQVNILKSVFAGQNYTEAANTHSCAPQTVSRIVNSEQGGRLLSLLQYHLKLLEGPSVALRRAMLWRIAVKEEIPDPKTSIKAISELNKMHFQDHQMNNPDAGGKEIPVTAQVVVNINQQILPRGALDK